MAASVNVLLLEDDPADVALVKRALAVQIADCAVDHAESHNQYLELLKSKTFDAVLSDGSVTGCEGLRAFYLARERQPRVAFIYIAGFDANDLDPHGLKALGISDFPSKADLNGLGGAVEKALRERRESSEGAKALAGYERLVSVVQELSLARDLAGIMAIVRRAAREVTGADGATFVLRDGDCCYYADEDAIGPLWKGQ